MRRKLHSVQRRVVGYGLLFAGLILALQGARYLNFLSSNAQQANDLFKGRVSEKLAEFQTVEKDTSFLTIMKWAKTASGLVPGPSGKRLITLSAEASLTTLIYHERDLKFWSSNEFLPQNPQTLPLGPSLAWNPAGIFLVMRVVRSPVNVILVSKVKHEYQAQKEYFPTGFTPSFALPPSVELHPVSTAGALLVRMADGKPLCYLSLNAEKQAEIRASITGYAWLALLFAFFISSFWMSRKQSGKNKVLAAFAFSVVFPLIVRLPMILFHIPHAVYGLKLFSPALYSNNTIFYSLGDLAFNVFSWALLCNWAIIACESKKNPIPTGIFLSVFLASGFFLIDQIFRSIVEDSTVPHDLITIYRLNEYSVLCMLLLALSFSTLYWICKLLATVFSFIRLKATVVYILSIAAVTGALFLSQRSSPLPAFLCAAFVLSVFFYQRLKKPEYYLLIIVIGTLLSTERLSHLSEATERHKRVVLAEKLHNAGDPIAEIILDEKSALIAQDVFLNELVKTGTKLTSRFLQASQYLQDNYLGPKFAGYSVESFLYNDEDQLVSGPERYPLATFVAAAHSKTMRPVASFFFQLQTSMPDYLGIIPLTKAGVRSGTLVLHIIAGLPGGARNFAALFKQGRPVPDNGGGEYSYAYYEQGHLLDKYGKYAFPVIYPASRSSSVTVFRELDGMSLLIYQPEAGTMILIAKQNLDWINTLTVFSYLLLAALIIFGVVYTLEQTLGKTVRKRRFLYKTKIQLSLIFSVLTALFVTGWISLSALYNQYAHQQQDTESAQIENIRKEFETEMPVETSGVEETAVNFFSLASRHSVDLSYYDTNGSLQYSTLARLYSSGILSAKMNPEAYYEMYVSGKTELVNYEQIGKILFSSLYAPVRNSDNQVIGYLNMPFFPNQDEKDRQVYRFLGSLINVYVLVFVTIVVLALLLARSITRPLEAIERELTKADVEGSAQTAYWKRDDEIGDLVAAYNAMVIALKQNAAKLARAERETAWKEMAKQVAHEIKNPLTPLQLGMQHLQQALDGDQQAFVMKFKRFSATFLEQVQSLARIADEFSHFAKMPKIREEVIDLKQLVSSAVDLFKEDEYELEMEAAGSQWNVLADRDQLLRIFNNLLKNAAQSIPSNRRGAIHVSITSSGASVTVSIADNGSGIDENLRQKIFYPNFTSKSSGSGLGLAFVKNAVEAAGGNVSFISSPNGTTFSVVLPIYNLKESSLS